MHRGTLPDMSWTSFSLYDGNESARELIIQQYFAVPHMLVLSKVETDCHPEGLQGVCSIGIVFCGTRVSPPGIPNDDQLLWETISALSELGFQADYTCFTRQTPKTPVGSSKCSPKLEVSETLSPFSRVLL